MRRSEVVMRLSVAVVAITLGWAVPGHACTVARDVEAERANWIEVHGTYEEQAATAEDQSFDLTICRSKEPCNPVKKILRWVQITHEGRAIASDGTIYVTRHTTGTTEPLSCAPDKPKRSATGVFYLELDREGGVYVIEDWVGNYREEPLPMPPAGEDMDEAAE